MDGIKRETSITFKGHVENDEREYQPNTWQGRLDRRLNQAASQAAVVTVVLLDLLVVTALLLIDQNVIKNPRAQDKSVNTSSIPANQQYKDLAIQTAESALHITQITILSLFLLEVTLRICAKLKGLVNDPLQMFDCLVVLATFTLYLALYAALPQRTAAYACGYIIILRLWRLGRLYHAIIYPIKEMASRDKLFYVNAQKFTEDKLRKAREELDETRKENNRLKEQIRMLENSSNYIIPPANIGRSFTSPDVYIYADATTDTMEGQTNIPDESYKCLRLPNGNTRTNTGNPNGHSVFKERSDSLQAGMGTKVPDVVENTPEHSVCSSSDLREDFGSQNLQLGMEEQQQVVADIDVHIEVSDHKTELPGSLGKSTETGTSEIAHGARLVSKLDSDGTNAKSDSTLRRNTHKTAEPINTAISSLPQQSLDTLIQSATAASSSQKPFTSTTRENAGIDYPHLCDIKGNETKFQHNHPLNAFEIEKEKLVHVSHQDSEFAYLNLGFDTSLTPEELLEVQRISQVPFQDTSHTKEDGNIPMTDL